MEAELIRAKFNSAILAAMDSACTHPSRWGSDDCGLWCCAIIERVLGYDPGEPYRSRYNSREGVREVLGAKGLPGALKRVVTEHGWQKIRPCGPC